MDSVTGHLTYQEPIQTFTEEQNDIMLLLGNDGPHAAKEVADALSLTTDTDRTRIRQTLSRFAKRGLLQKEDDRYLLPLS